MPLFRYLKKAVVLMFAGLAISLVNINNASAQGYWEQYLQIIADNTGKILVKINDIPTLLQNLVTLVGELKINLLSADDSAHTASMQQQFTQLGNLIVQNANPDSVNQLEMTAHLLGDEVKVTDFSQPKDKPKILEIMPNINDIVYSTVLGKPLVPNASHDPNNYIENASGISLIHNFTRPNSTWMGSDPAKLRYWNYYNSVSAATSYSAYMLTKQMSGDKSLSAVQLQLVQQASNADWMTSIATQEIGKVLRQILMFDSQTYVLLTRFMQAQQDLLTAQLMTNTILIANNSQYQAAMAASAQGVQPKL